MEEDQLSEEEREVNFQQYLSSITTFPVKSYNARNEEARNAIENTRKKTDVEGLKDYYELRKQWSGYLKIIFFITIFFQIYLTVLIGLGRSKFPIELRYFPYLVAGENFAQIVGLLLVLVKFLFPESQEKNKT